MNGQGLAKDEVALALMREREKDGPIKVQEKGGL